MHTYFRLKMKKKTIKRVLDYTLLNFIILIRKESRISRGGGGGGGGEGREEERRGFW